MVAQQPAGMLSPYRVLDLADEKGFLCGKLLGDLGADVIKVEPPGGDPGRRRGPFWKDQIDSEKSLSWLAFNVNKRGITLNIETADGQALLKRLASTSDFIIECCPPGYMDERGLGYSSLAAMNPRIIMVSITPFGQTGPYSGFKAPDIVAWAMGGQIYPYGDADRPPVRVSHHSQAYLQAAAAAASGAMMALYHRSLSGEGQHVDVSAQEVVARLLEFHAVYWDMMGVSLGRQRRSNGNVRRRQLWPCKDGYVIWLYWSGQASEWNLRLFEWMESEGMSDDFLRSFDWENLDFATVTQEIVDLIEEPTLRFFMAHTRAELHEGALRHHVMLCPVDTTADTMASAQLAAREFWTEVEYPELDSTITYPGPWVRSSGAPPGISRRAPFVGEHNAEIYENELGVSRENLAVLRQSNVI